jgi:hypothetical protein
LCCFSVIIAICTKSPKLNIEKLVHVGPTVGSNEDDCAVGADMILFLVLVEPRENEGFLAVLKG